MNRSQRAAKDRRDRLLASIFVGGLAAIVMYLSIFGAPARPLVLQPTAAPVAESTAQPTGAPVANAFVAHSTPTSSPAPASTPTPDSSPTPAAAWTTAASWSPDGERFTMDTKPARWIMVGRVGDRCQLQLPTDPKGNQPQPWVPCSVIGLH